jgi:iron complex transport system ATP-binding protein
MEILELLRASADRGMTILLITHEIESVARFADRMLLLSRGRVAAEGTAADVIRENVLRAVYEWPISVQQDPATRTPRIVPMRRGPDTLQGSSAELP